MRELCGATSIDYIYGTEGIAGFVVDKDTNNEATYVYRKNIFGDVTAVYNADGILQCTYEYDAWGSHVIYDTDGKVVDGTGDNIGLINPIRYRGYYFDEETGLYYLKTRYYDPQVGRFMTIDGIEYLDPETINGLNLYAYCNNNPVMNVDPDGNKWWHWLIGAISVVAGAILCFVPGGQIFGAGLIVGGTSTLISESLLACGVDGKAASIVVSGLSIVAGVALCFTPLAGIGASLVGQGVGSLAGGFISESLGGGFETGAAIGGIIGSIVGGFAYRGITRYRLSKMTPYEKGVMGEKYVKAVSGIKPHTMNSGKLRPDFIDGARGILIDSKNVASQGLTSQLKSYLGLGFNKSIIYVRLGTKISAALENSAYIIKYFPW